MIFESIPLLIYVLAQTILCIVFFVQIRKLKKKLISFTKGKDGSSLEEMIAWLTKKTAETDELLTEHKKKLNQLNGRLKTSIRGISLVHYDAYEGIGGKQSFSLAILDENQNGAIVSSIINRNHSAVYAREVREGVSLQTLTEEETQVLAEVIKKYTYEYANNAGTSGSRNGSH
jgi:hypothetical protein